VDICIRLLQSCILLLLQHLEIVLPKGHFFETCRLSFDLVLSKAVSLSLLSPCRIVFVSGQPTKMQRGALRLQLVFFCLRAHATSFFPGTSSCFLFCLVLRTLESSIRLVNAKDMRHTPRDAASLRSFASSPPSCRVSSNESLPPPGTVHVC
jgi:hypothetical protein